MIILLIQLSFSKHIFDFELVRDKISLLYIESYEIIQIHIKSGYGIFFSSWDKFDNILMEVYFETPNEKSVPIQKFDSSNGLIGIAFKSNDFILRIRNEGTDKYKLYVMISNFIPSVHTPNVYHLPDGISLPIEKYAVDANLGDIRDLNSPYIINFDSQNSKSLAVNISVLCILALVLVIYIITIL